MNYRFKKNPISEEQMDSIIKNRALFFYSVAVLNDDFLIVDENVMYLLNTFTLEYFSEYYELFSLIYDFEYASANELIVNDILEYDRINTYLDYFNSKDTKYINKIYDDIGVINATKISKLAELFSEYINKEDEYIKRYIRQ